MELRATFTLSLYSLTALAGLILGGCEGGWIPYGSLPLVVIGALWTERTAPDEHDDRGLSDRFAALLGLTALGLAWREFFSENLEGRLLSGTHLVVYLTWIVLLQRKTARRYWLLLALGLLQVAVAAVLISGPASGWYGLALVAYIFAAVWTLSLFSLVRAANQAIQSCLSGEHGASVGSVRWDRGEGISWPFASSVLITGFAGLVMGALFFALVPRVWLGGQGVFAGEDLQGGIGGSQFASEVKLGDLGPILERMDPVLRLRLHGPGARQVTPQEYAERLGMAEPLFRGAVLTTYSGQTWKLDPGSIQKSARLFPVTNRPMIRQELRMEDVGKSALLCLGFPTGLVDDESRPRGSFQWTTQLLYRRPDLNERGAVRYHVLSEFPDVARDGVFPVSAVERRRFAESGVLTPLRVVPESLVRTRQLARQIVQAARERRGRDLTPLESARALESFLRDSGQYSYQLDQTIVDHAIDPVEDFLFNRKQGHCEYFASALVLLLRSVGLPARLVSGYKGGIYDDATRTLTVQQRHAHAWCEAWIDDSAWVVLDATPVDERMASVEAVSTNQSTWEWMQSHVTGLWSENVVNISLEKQEEAFYGPLRTLARQLLQFVRDGWTSPAEMLLRLAGILFDPRHWFSLAGSAALLMTLGLGWLVFRMRLWAVGRRTGSCIPATPRLAVEFYDRLLKALERNGLRKGNHQTPREFAGLAAEQCGIAGSEFAQGPAELSELYYRVRFGHSPLNAAETQDALQLVAALENALKPAASCPVPTEILSTETPQQK